MGMFDDIVTGVSENIEINGYPFYAENIDSQEPFNRRDYEFKPVVNGTLVARRGKYIQRKYSFQTTLYHKNRPDEHDKILAEICSKPVEVISPSMGGKFKAIVTFTKSIDEGSKYHTDYDVDIVEVPTTKSRIPGEKKLVVPAIKKVTPTKGKKLSKEDKKIFDKLSKCKLPFTKNSKSNCVKLLQNKLIELKFLDKKHKTGKYDKKTIQAVKKLQKSSKGKLVIDGEFGKYTLEYMFK